MDLFVRKHQKKINGTLGCFDRMRFRGYLPIQSGWSMAEFLKQKMDRYFKLPFRLRILPGRRLNSF